MNDVIYKTGGRWFEKHSKSDFTLYTKIMSRLDWSYWIATKYGYLAGKGSTKKAESLIDKYRDEISKNMRSAVTAIRKWDACPSDMKMLLTATSSRSNKYISHTIKSTDRVIFHNKYGVNIEESEEEFLNDMEEEQYLIRIFLQHTDEADLTHIYIKWVYVIYEIMKRLVQITDDKSWEITRIYCLENLRGILPIQRKIESSASATIAHIEIIDDMRSDISNKYTDLWLQLFMSLSQYNRAIQLFASSIEYPSDSDLERYMSQLDEAVSKHMESSIQLSKLLLSEDIYSS